MLQKKPCHGLSSELIPVIELIQGLKGLSGQESGLQAIRAQATRV